MQSIDLNTIMQEREISKSRLAKLLFPNNSYPELALKRILKGYALLDADQISKLALYLDVSIGYLYNGRDWTSKPITAEGTLSFCNGDYRAELKKTRAGWHTRLFHKKSLFHEEVINSDTVKLKEYLHNLNLLIKKFENE